MLSSLQVRACESSMSLQQHEQKYHTLQAIRSEGKWDSSSHNKLQNFPLPNSGDVLISIKSLFSTPYMKSHVGSKVPKEDCPH